MSGSFQIAQIKGIPVQVHWTFGFVPLFVLYYGWQKNLDIAGSLWVALAAVGLFLSILLHELGHALTAKRYGVETKDIILLPIGGLARLKNLPKKPLQELLVAIAGPCVNVALAALILPYLIIVTAPGLMDRPVSDFHLLIGDFFYFLPGMFLLNLGLAVFNLVPAFPMDGGRVLRALLSIKLGRFTATRVAVALGQILAACMMVFGIWSNNYSYVFIGIFIYVTGAQEFRWAKTEHLLQSVKVGDVMKTDIARLLLNDSLQAAVDLRLRQAANNFLVFDEQGTLVGTLSEADILEGQQAHRQDEPLVNVCRPITDIANYDDDLKTAADKMKEADVGIIPVFQQGKLAGVVDIEIIRSALGLKKFY